MCLGVRVIQRDLTVTENWVEGLADVLTWQIDFLKLLQVDDFVWITLMDNDVELFSLSPTAESFEDQADDLSIGCWMDDSEIEQAIRYV